jgi:hypothetical protein
MNFQKPDKRNDPDENKNHQYRRSTAKLHKDLADHAPDAEIIKNRAHPAAYWTTLRYRDVETVFR